MVNTYDTWLVETRAALSSINMPMGDWQERWTFDFEGQYRAGATPNEAAEKANRFWWRQQNKSLRRDCQLTADCWLPQGHQGDCQPAD
jgi:hypothetical protein